MPLSRLPERPHPPPAVTLTGAGPTSPAEPVSASPPSAQAGPQASLPTTPVEARRPAVEAPIAAVEPTPSIAAQARPVEAPTAPQLQGAARELVQAAERAERQTREILSRAMALSDRLAKSLDRGERRTPAGDLAMLLCATLLCAASAALSTLVTLAVLHPQVSLLDLLRIVWHKG